MWTMKQQGAALPVKQSKDGDMEISDDMAAVFWSEVRVGWPS